MSVRAGVAGAVLLLGASAFAAGSAVVAVDGCEAGTTASSAQLLRDALGRSPSTGTISLEDTTKRLGGAPRGSLADAERLLASARFDVLDQAAYDRADRTLQTVIEDLRALPASEARWQDLRDAQTLLAFLYVRQNRKEAAEETIQELLAADPKTQPSGDLYPPSFRSFVEDQRKKLAKKTTSSLKVLTVPSGRPVIVEGRVVGTSPATVKLPPGRYRVEADFGTGGGVPRFVELGESATLELTKDFEGQIFAGKGPCVVTDGSREGRLNALVRLAGLLNVDEVVGVRTEEPSSGERFIVATAIDARSGQETREGKVKVRAGSPDAASVLRLGEFLSTGSAVPPVEMLLGGTQTPVVATKATPAGTSVPPAVGTATDASVQAPVKKSGGSAMRTASYVVGGVGIASLAGSAIFFGQVAATNERIEDLAEVGPDGKKFYPLDRVGPLFTERDNQQTTAYVLAGVGAAGVIVGVTLFVLGADDAPVAEPVAGVTVMPTANGVLVRF